MYIQNSKKLLIGLSSFLLSTTLFATDNNATVTKDIVKTPSNWYQLGSYGYPQTNEWLIYVSGSLAYMFREGNDKENRVKATATGIVRKNHWTLTGEYTKRYEKKESYEDKHTVVPSTSTTDEYAGSASLMYDINKYLFTSVGYENSRDISFEVYNKTVYYGGLGLRAIRTKSHLVNIYAAYGNEDISFGTYPILPSGDTDGQYYQIDYLWLVNEMLSLNVNYNFMKTDMDYRDTSKLTISATAKITEHVSLVLSYSDEYMKVQETVERETNDRITYTSIKFNF